MLHLIYKQLGILPGNPDRSNTARNNLGIGYSTQHIESVSRWARQNNIEIVVSSDCKDLLACDVIYLPMRHNFGSIDFPADIPLIIDYDCECNAPGLQRLTKKNRTAARIFHYSKIGRRSAQFDFAVPYLHLPLVVDTKEKRDLVMVDFHKWDGTISYMKAFIRLNEASKFASKYYYNCPVLLETLRKMHTITTATTTRRRGRKDFPFLTNVLPYKEKFQDYIKLFSRARLFVAYDNWMNDLDVFNAYIAGLPLLAIPNPMNYTHPSSYIITHLEPKLKEEFNRLSGQRAWSIRNDVPVERFRNVYMKTWDMLWEWALYRKRDEGFMKLL